MLVFACYDGILEISNQTIEPNRLEVNDTVTVRVTDEQAKQLIKKYSKCDNASDFQALDTKTRDRCLKKLREKGLSIRQLSRLTGISFSIVRRY